MTLRPEQQLALIPQEALVPMYTKQRLTAAFKDLRKLGYIALQNFACCNNCAGYEIATRVKDMPAGRQDKLAGAVYYHRQDADALAGTKVRSLYLKFGPVTVWGGDGTTSNTYGKAHKAIAEDVCKALRDHGLDVEWGGDTDRCIVVHGLNQTTIDAAAATLRLGGNYQDVLNHRASGK